MTTAIVNPFVQDVMKNTAPSAALSADCNQDDRKEKRECLDVLKIEQGLEVLQTIAGRIEN